MGCYRCTDAATAAGSEANLLGHMLLLQNLSML